MENNKICNNKLYNFKYTNRVLDFQLNNVCWCTNDTNEIRKKIFDGKVDLEIAYVNIGNPVINCTINENQYKNPDSLKISGTVHYGKLDNKEKNAQVIAYNLDNQNIYSTYTDSLGQFKFDSLSIGKYILKTTPSTPNHIVTFYPATRDSLQSIILDLKGVISGIDIIIDIETGISNDTEDNEIKVYPNPFDNLLHIRNFNKNINYNKISIENSIGDVKLEFNQADETSEIILDLNILPAGVYFLNLETIDSKIIRKVIKN